MNSLILGDQEIDSANVESMQKRDVYNIVRPGYRSKSMLQSLATWLTDFMELLEFPNFAQRNVAPRVILVAANVFESRLVNENVNAVVVAELLQFRKLRSDLLLIFETDEDVCIN